MLTIGAPTVNSAKIPKIKHLDYRLESDISAPTIKVAKSQKALEMVFDCDLKFNSHIVEVKKVIRILGLIRWTFKHLDSRNSDCCLATL